MSVVQLQPTVAPELLGGATTVQIPMGPVYERLARKLRPAPADLAGVHSNDASFSSDTVQEDFLSIHGGYFTLGYVIKDGLYFISAAVWGSSEYSFTVVFPESQEISLAVHKPFECHEFYSALTITQRDALAERILHLFLRTCGSTMDVETCGFLCSYLRRQYVKNKYWKEMVDLCTTFADLAFTTGDDQLLTLRLVMLGEALENIGRFADAAPLYEEIADRFGDQDLDSAGLHRSNLLQFAAAAYMRCGDFGNSEKIYVLALHAELYRLDGSWASRTEWKAMLLGEMANMYAEMQIQQAHETQQTVMDAKFEAALVALCHISGIHFEKGLVQKNCLSILRSKYRQPKIARKVLKSAVAKPVSVDNFRSTILACVVKNGKYLFFSDPAKCSGSPQETRNRWMKLSARQHVEGQTAGASTGFHVACSNPACGKTQQGPEFQSCPCQTVVYVSICQRAHWKEHKQVCPLRNKKPKQAS